MNTHSTSTINGLQKAIIILGGIVAPIFVICTLTKSPETPALADSAETVDARIKPIAVVEVDSKSASSVEKNGEEVVKTACAACHLAGVLGSPKIGDMAAWKPRIAQGYEKLTRHAIEGIRTMPARGGSADLSDGEVARAVVHMANQSGASFKLPQSAVLAAEPAK
ncbi:MAG: c-type cytochrome [Methylophilaceae bacterium]